MSADKILRSFRANEKFAEHKVKQFKLITNNSERFTGDKIYHCKECNEVLGVESNNGNSYISGKYCLTCGWKIDKDKLVKVNYEILKQNLDE